MTPARVWISCSPGSRREGRVLVFRRRDGRFLGARVTAGPTRVLGARGDLVYLAERAGGRERLVARQEFSFRVKRSWELPPGPWEVAAFAFAKNSRESMPQLFPDPKPALARLSLGPGARNQLLPGAILLGHVVLPALTRH